MIRYVTGDATRPLGSGPRIIAHVCNDIGAWGAGFVIAVSRRWPQPEADYRAWAERGPRHPGAVQFVPVGDQIVVANMIAQRGVGGARPLRYGALYTCLGEVAAMAIRTDGSVHMPRIGCGLAGGSWEMVEALVEESLCERQVPVTVYDLPVSR